MSVEFIRDKRRSNSLFKACRQQKRILQYGKSDIQMEGITTDYLQSYVDRFYATDDMMSNFMKSLLKTDNFMSVYDFVRKPLASSRIANKDIKQSFLRVLHAEDSYFSYTINGKTKVKKPSLVSDSFYEEFVDNLIFRPNDIYITDLKDINKPYTYLLSIENVINVGDDGREIVKIAFNTSIKKGGEDVPVIAYIDDSSYKIYDKEDNLLVDVSHDLGYCPARFVSSTKKNQDFIIRESILSDVLPEMEYYNLLEACNKLIEIKGAFPVTVRLEKSKSNTNELRNALEIDPENEEYIGGQASEEQSDFKKTENNKNDVGTTYTMTLEDIEDGNSNINMDILKNFITHFHIPVEILKHLKEQLITLRKQIIDTVVGTHISEEQEGSKTDTHLEEKLSHQEDRLRHMSKDLTLLVQGVETTELALEHGIDNIRVDIFFGSKFFLESEKSLLDKYQLKTNPIEKREIIKKLNNKRNLFNQSKKERNDVLYDILPYADDGDFERAIARGVEDEVFELQNRFNYWVSLFETINGNIVDFVKAFGENRSAGMHILKTEIYKLIKNEITKKTDSTERVQED